MKKSLRSAAQRLIGRRRSYFHYQKGARRARPLSMLRVGVLFAMMFSLLFTSVGGGIMDKVANYIAKEFFSDPRPLVANAKIEGEPAKVETIASPKEQKLAPQVKEELAQAQ